MSSTASSIILRIKDAVKRYTERIRAKGPDYATEVAEIGLSLALGLFIGGIILVILGYNPAWVYRVLFYEGSKNIDYLITRSAPVLLTGLAFSIPLKAGFFNIAGESQLYVGALASLLVAYYTGNPVLALLAGMAAGALLGLGIAGLRVYKGVNEVIIAIMVNWIFYYLIAYLVAGVIYDPKISHQSISVPHSAQLGEFTTPLGPLKAAFFVAVLGALFTYYIIYHTKIGYFLRVSGLNPRSARYAGFSPEKSILYSMMLAGAMGGLGGAILIQGIVYSIDSTMSAVYGLGFLGIGIGLLGRNHPFGIILSAIFFNILIIGGQGVERKVGAPPELADVLIGVIIVALAVPYAYRMLVNKLFLQPTSKVSEK